MKRSPSKKKSRPARSSRTPDAGSGFSQLLGRKVILDTAGPIMFLGKLAELKKDGIWLEDADIRDRNEGHVSKERYACEARENGIRANRRRIFVAMSVIISASALDDVVVDFPDDVP